MVNEIHSNERRKTIIEGIKQTLKRPLGKVQEDVLDSLLRHQNWHRFCGWIWDTPSNTERIMDALVKRGIAEIKDGSYQVKEEFVAR